MGIANQDPHLLAGDESGYKGCLEDLYVTHKKPPDIDGRCARFLSSVVCAAKELSTFCRVHHRSPLINEGSSDQLIVQQKGIVQSIQPFKWLLLLLLYVIVTKSDTILTQDMSLLSDGGLGGVRVLTAKTPTSPESKRGQCTVYSLHVLPIAL